MTLDQLERQVPALKDYTNHMPEEIRMRCVIHTYPAGSTISRKGMELNRFGIVALGENRVVNELENGNVFVIETNKAIDFIGEVALVAGMEQTSVTIEAMTESVIVFISQQDAKHWLDTDINILRLVAQHIAFKLYRCSSSNGTKLFYPPSYLLMDYVVNYAVQRGFEDPNPPEHVTVNRTRQQLQEELGVPVKTLNRTISRLKSDGFLDVQKGKITFTPAQYELAKRWLEIVRYK